jgi:hypothetical protein
MFMKTTTTSGCTCLILEYARSIDSTTADQHLSVFAPENEQLVRARAGFRDDRLERCTGSNINRRR